MKYRERRGGEEVKENFLVRYPLKTRTLLVGVATCIVALFIAAALDARLPEPKTVATAKPTDFIAENAMAHLVNLTEIGPRVAGSYENEVLARARVVHSLRQVASAASIHNRVEWDAAAADGGFALTFFDGLNSVYRGVRGVVARLRPAADSPRSAALLLNCHTDTVPDSPGASDDGAGCAVMLEAARALVAGAPLRRPVLLLLNSAEENIMQGSHAFVTSHPWAKSARTFINLEACGAGGREVLFQAGPQDPWLLEMYASLVPHPFASSVAQELFESGLIPADTDFRVFRDFGRLSGLDLAWSSNGWVYHTKLDDVTRIPLSALQRTGENVLALMRGVQASDWPEGSPPQLGPPVYFDIGGVFVVILGTHAAAAAALGLLALLALRVWLDIKLSESLLHVSGPRYRGAAGRAAAAGAGGAAAGALGAAGAGAALHLAAPLAYYTHTALLLPLYILPATCLNWAVTRYLFSWWGSTVGGGAQRWAVVGRAGWLATAALPALGLLLGLVFRLRSALVPALWTVAHLPHLLLGLWELANNKLVSLRVYAAATLIGVAVPLVQASSMCVGLLDVLLPLLGRAGTAIYYPDVVVGVTCALMWSCLCAWLLPLVLLARIPTKLYWCALVVTVCAFAAARGVSPYSALRPHRLMLFHTRRTLHRQHHAGNATVDHYYWIPHLDVNTPTAAADYLPGLLSAGKSGEECEELLYCGAPYYLPVLQLIRAGYKLPAATPPAPALTYNYTLEVLDENTVRFNATLHGTAHIMVILSPVAGAFVSGCDAVPGALQPAARWRSRRTYFLLLHTAAPPPAPPITLSCLMKHQLAAPPPYWLDVSAAAHALFAEQAKTPEHRQLEDSLPDWIAPTGWGVDLHLHTL